MTATIPYTRPMPKTTNSKEMRFDMRLTAEAAAMLDSLAKHIGGSKAHAVETAIREAAAARGIRPTTSDEAKEG